MQILLKTALFLAALMMTFSCGGESTREGPASLLPNPPQGWRKAGDGLAFTGIELSDYIDGGAEAYFAYGFRRLAVREFRNPAGARITVEIYEMDRPENAYGIYSTDPAGEHWPIAKDASYGHGLLRFWKGLYFVRIMCFPPEPGAEAAVRQVGKGIADSIEVEGGRPPILGLLPETGVVPDTACYLHRQTSLNNVRFVSDENVLHLGDEVEALTWEQRIPEGALRLILIRYPSVPEAEAAFEDFGERYLLKGLKSTHTETSLIARAPDRGYAGADIQAPWLMVVLDAPSPEAASEALSHTRTRLAIRSGTSKEGHDG